MAVDGKNPWFLLISRRQPWKRKASGRSLFDPVRPTSVLRIHPDRCDVPMEILGIQWEISRILKWMHVSTIFLAIWIGGISPYIALTWALYMVGHCRGVTDLTSDDFWWVCWMGQSLIPCCTPHWHDPWGENSKRNGRDDLWTCTYHHLSPSWDVWCNKSSNVEILATTRILH